MKKSLTLFLVSLISTISIAAVAAQAKPQPDCMYRCAQTGTTIDKCRFICTPQP